jgi:8-oxo-dGTP diphosphatase
MGIILYLVSYILNFIFTPFVIIYTLCRKWNTDYYFTQIAIATDKKGNIICQYLFNDILIKKDGYKFGQDGETISFVLDKNFQEKSLTLLGSGLSYILRKLKDPAFK